VGFVLVTSDHLTIGQVARLSGLTPKALRHKATLGRRHRLVGPLSCQASRVV
jgi:hypothetical protein